jgi:sugar O-acyltransferase (sialic acid O-acetyltransferase NeuD family)
VLGHPAVAAVSDRRRRSEIDATIYVARYRFKEAFLQIEQGMDPIVVIGGGGHAKVVISILRKLNRFRILGYTDLHDHGVVLEAPYLGSDRELAALDGGSKNLNAALAVGQVGLGEKRHELWTRLCSPALAFPLIISPDAIVNEEVSCGEGSVVMDGAVINSGATLGRGAIVNTNSTVEHDVVLADWVHVAPGATISGGAVVGQFSMIGAGATVIEGIKIAAGCMIGAGAVIVRDLTEPGVYVGSPARRIK